MHFQNINVSMEIKVSRSEIKNKQKLKERWQKLWEWDKMNFFIQMKVGEMKDGGKTGKTVISGLRFGHGLNSILF